MAKPTPLTWAYIGLIFVSGVSVAVAAAEQATATFYESFDSNWKGRWIVTKNSEYKGRWKYEKSSDNGNYGLLVSEKAKKYGITYDLPHVVDPNVDRGTLTFQYDVRFQKGIECGGAYLKFLLPQDGQMKQSEINNESPYSIMFGADKCGSTNKVHFIFRHQHPLTGDFVEHHMQHPALVVIDTFTHVYTATIYPDNNVKIFVDGELAKNCNLMGDDFDPPLIPPLLIPDPTDEKPSDWDERRKILDPNASKPDDWNEDEPPEIVDTDAVKPKGWLDDEPEEIDDPDSTKPADWNETEDGEWEPEKIDNPKCENAPGCGHWKPPMKNNPAYRGKWAAPLIDNPNYNGVWQAKQIPNPDHFTITRPQLEKIGRIGIEIWTMDDGILFDNILITNNESLADDIRDRTWSKKIKIEKKIEVSEDANQSLHNILRSPFSIKGKLFEGFYAVIDWVTKQLPFLEPYKYQVVIAVKTIEENSFLMIGIFGTIPVLLISIYSLTFTRKDLAKLKRKRSPQEGKEVESTTCDDTNTIPAAPTATPSDAIQRAPKDEDQDADCFHEIEKDKSIPQCEPPLAQ